MNIKIDSVSLEATGPTLTLSLEAGRTLGIFGPSSSGKSKFLRAIVGHDRPVRGKVKLAESAALAEIRVLSRRVSPLSIAKKVAGQGGATRVAEALSATHLWEERKSPISGFSNAQMAACEMMVALASPSRVLAFDGQFESLDIWTQARVLALMGKRLREGASILLVSNSISLAGRVDSLVVLNSQRIVFAGSIQALERKFPQSEISIETTHQTGVRALVQPLSIKVEKVQGGLKAQVAEGQDLAAKLLTEGYGDVKAVIWKRPSVEDLMKSLIAD
jgi:ABC-type multidrug transport system ATPase subunit